VIDSEESDDGNHVVYGSRPAFNGSGSNYAAYDRSDRQNIAVLPSKQIPVNENDDLEEVVDPALAAIIARAREKAAQAGSGKAPIAELLITPEIPDAKPLLLKVRIDHTLEKARLAWCGKQNYSPEMTRSVILTWKGSQVYDSTTVKRLGIQVDTNGNVSIEGDSNIYDDSNLPKVHVEAWTEELHQQRRKEDAAEAAAKKKAAEPTPVIEERTPTPEPVAQVQKIRLILKAKGKEDFKLSVNPVRSCVPIYNFIHV
jgi:sRNA-binding protein